MKTDLLLEPTLEKVGKKLTELRIARGYKSHETFALDHDLPRVQYWRMEKGRVNFTFKTLGRILIIHQLSIEEFFSSMA